MSADTIIELNGAGIYHGENKVLSDVNLSIPRGQFVYLIGKTASGKSSLIKTLTGELALQEGSGRVAQFMLDKLKSGQIPLLRRTTGIVFQDFQLLTDRTVYDNLLFVLKATGWSKKAEIDARIAEVLTKVGLTNKERSMPNQLSGGEQQRVVIARALLNDPVLILADEPTGPLDPETSIEIAALLHSICQYGKTVVMATHNYTLLKRFPARTLHCGAGAVTEVNENSNSEFIELEED